MAVQSVNSVKFCGNTTETSNKENHIQRNIGKYAGMGIGAAAGTSFGLYRAIKPTVKMKRGFIYGHTLGIIFNSENKSLSEILKELGITSKQFRQDRTKQFIKVMKSIPVILGTLTLLAGLGIGAIVDAVIKHNKSKKES